VPIENIIRPTFTADLGWPTILELGICNLSTHTSNKSRANLPYLVLEKIFRHKEAVLVVKNSRSPFFHRIKPFFWVATQIERQRPQQVERAPTFLGNGKSSKVPFVYRCKRPL